MHMAQRVVEVKSEVKPEKRLFSKRFFEMEWMRYFRQMRAVKRFFEVWSFEKWSRKRESKTLFEVKPGSRLHPSPAPYLVYRVIRIFSCGNWLEGGFHIFKEASLIDESQWKIDALPNNGSREEMFQKCYFKCHTCFEGWDNPWAYARETEWRGLRKSVIFRALYHRIELAIISAHGLMWHWAVRSLSVLFASDFATGCVRKSPYSWISSETSRYAAEKKDASAHAKSSGTELSDTETKLRRPNDPLMCNRWLCHIRCFDT